MNYVIQKKPIPKIFDENGEMIPGVHFGKAWHVSASSPEEAWEKFKIYTTAPEREDYVIGSWGAMEQK